MHQSAFDHMLDLANEFLVRDKHYHIVDVGSRLIKHQVLTHRQIFRDYNHTYLGLDVAAGDNVDVVLSDAYSFPLETDCADLVISGQVFEHVPFFWATFLEMSRIVKPGGLIFLTAPSRGHVHSPPYDCWRYYPDGYRSLAAFASLELVRCHTDFPPQSTTSKRRFDYAEVPPSRYWGDTVGVFRKDENYKGAEIAKLASVLLPWVNSRADIDAFAPKAVTAPVAIGGKVLVHKKTGIKFPANDELIRPNVQAKLESGRYEIREATAVRKYLHRDARVLELGAGIGFMSTLVERDFSPAAYTAVEADFRLIPIIRETHRLNNVSGVSLFNAVATSDPTLLEAGHATLNYTSTFWGSSIIERGATNGGRTTQVAVISFEKILRETQSDTIICDIEGGEIGLFGDVDLSSIQLIIMEVHPRVSGEDAIHKMFASIARWGLVIEEFSMTSKVAVFRRPGNRFLGGAMRGLRKLGRKMSGG